jgi:hypothetical protein
MNVFRSETTTNDDIENIKNDIVTCDADTNDDIVISFKGFKHNKSGFILRVTNIERLTDATMEKWKGLVIRRGYGCELRQDFHDGWVEIICTRQHKKRTWKVKHLQQVGYLFVLAFSIYMLWQRHNKTPLK